MKKSTRAIAAAIPLVLLIGYAFVAVSISTPSMPTHSAVASIFSPYLSQKWNVFAPNIAKSNRSLEFQVQWRENEKLVKSEWVNLTAVEQTMVTGNPFPSRVSKLSLNASNTYMSRFRALPQAAQEEVRDTFITRKNGEFEAIPVEKLIEKLSAEDETSSTVVRLLRYDYMLMRLGTVVGAAQFDLRTEDVERVRWRITTTRVNDFSKRFEADQQYESTVNTFGWRQSTFNGDKELIDTYAAFFERYE